MEARGGADAALEGRAAKGEMGASAGGAEGSMASEINGPGAEE